MNKKEIGEIRRRYTPQKTAIKKIFGCYANKNKEIISNFEAGLGLLSEQETEKYLNFLKKTLSGTQGKNLIDIEFSTAQVADSPEHKLLMDLRNSELEDEQSRTEIFNKMMSAVTIEDANYLVLLACENFDVKYRSKDAMDLSELSDTSFRYIIGAVCPVKDGKSELAYSFSENAFADFMAKQIVLPPQVGFMFPAFDDRAANIYNALFYSKDSALIHDGFITDIFNTQKPMSSEEEKEIFQNILAEALEEDCCLEVVRSVHEQLREKIIIHKESKNPEILEVSVQEIGEYLNDSGVEETKVSTFVTKCKEEFGEGTYLKPDNIIDSTKFELNTAQVKISVEPEFSHLVKAKVVDGKKYILIPVDEDAQINGLGIKVEDE